MVQIDVRMQILMNQIEKNQEHLQISTQKLARNEEILNPGDDLSKYSTTQKLKHQIANEMTQTQSLQDKSSWFAMSVSFLEEIRETITRMSKLAMKANSPDLNVLDRATYDVQFQQEKQLLSHKIDGYSGEYPPGAMYREMAMFMGRPLPASFVGKTGVSEGINLFTGHQLEGFNSITLQASNSNEESSYATLSGQLINTALSNKQLTLDFRAHNIDNVYAGHFVTIKGSSGGESKEEKVEISHYSAEDQIITLKQPLSFDAGVGFDYTLHSQTPNRTIKNSRPETLQVPVASSYWGFDNYRIDELQAQPSTFVPLTEIEKIYRDTHGIADTELQPQTQLEKRERRLYNIFDKEFASLKDVSSANRMFTQLNNAENKVAILIAQQDAQASKQIREIELIQAKQSFNKEADYAFLAVDIAEEIQKNNKYQDLHTGMLDLGKRMSDNYRKLTRLVS